MTVILKNLYLLKKEILRFNGTPENYWNFTRSFKEFIVNKKSGFREKLNYLIQNCDGESKTVIPYCASLRSEIGYRKVLEILIEEFGQKHITVRTFIDELLSFPSIKGNYPDTLKKLY